jgi:hypothetical protein|tara:strand:- start:469 stop:681 length:213 start_codon:yes stop_codon:yes gene_type:complete
MAITRLRNNGINNKIPRISDQVVQGAILMAGLNVVGAKITGTPGISEENMRSASTAIYGNMQSKLGPEEV